MIRHSDDSDLWALLDRCVGTLRATRLFQVLEVEPQLLQGRTRAVSRAVLAQALTMLLFEDVEQARGANRACAAVEKRPEIGVVRESKHDPYA